MNKTGSKCYQPEPPEAVHVGRTNYQPANLQPIDSMPTTSEHVAALQTIVWAFVDLGFGSSAAQQALRPANENRPLLALADSFRRNTHNQ